MGMFARWDGGPVTVSYIGTQTIFTGSSGSVSFTVPALGGNQWVVVTCQFLGSSRTLSSIGGAAATKLVESANTGGLADTRSQIWIAKPAAGTTIVTIPTSTGTEAYSLYVVSNLINGGAASSTAVTTGSGTSLSSLSAPAGSAVISIAMLFCADTPATACTWSGGVTQDAFGGATAGISDLRWSPAHALPSVATTYGLSFSFNGGGFTTGSAVALR
ncbi:hypothetical protein [Hyphomicrobium sp. MC1]|uniref:hypothetical protein n=1 Tax=Hyphomicrobium sp. (strain MC1) TaxID=717785 RepID=UPI000213DAB7|nr:hypothetical protein [Hyphomicrobium sp. MC1]CCB64476.1 protein of unknown function [Hyphomicrobium sp. MC1]